MVTIKAQGASLSMNAIPTVVDPLADCPEQLPSIGIDCNLPLLVKDIGHQQLERLRQRRMQLLAELEKIDYEYYTLEQLVAVVDSPHSKEK
jgi:hypothetical protein